MSRRLIQITIYLVAIFLLANTISVKAGYLLRKSYTWLSVESGVYSVSVSAEDSCTLTLGLTSNFDDIYSLSNSVPSSFTILKQDVYFNFGFSISEYSYLVLFNNETSACFYTTFSTKVETEGALSLSDTYVELPYGITKTYDSFGYQLLEIKSQSSSPIKVDVYSDDLSVSTPLLGYFKSYTIYAYESETILTASSSYIYLNCRTPSGCPLSARYHSEFPIMFIAFCLFMVIILLVARRRRMLMLASTNKTTSSNENFVLAEHTIKYVPQPFVAQPYYGNQAHSQPVNYKAEPVAFQNPYYKPGVDVDSTNVSEPIPNSNL